jgi:hypothetical protein
MSWAEATPHGFQCCFCDGNVPADDPCLVRLLLLGLEDSSQELWGHAGCLRRVVQPGVPLLIPEEGEKPAEVGEVRA